MALKIVDPCSDPTATNFVGISRDRISDVLSDARLIRALALQLVEGHVEMWKYMDGDAAPGEGVQSFSELQLFMNDCKDSCHEYICDLLGEFQEELLKAVARVEININTAEWDKDGLKDIYGTVRMGADNA